MYVQNKIPYKIIFSIFPILRINEKAPFCNLFIEQLKLRQANIGLYMQ